MVLLLVADVGGDASQARDHHPGRAHLYRERHLRNDQRRLEKGRRYYYVGCSIKKKIFLARSANLPERLYILPMFFFLYFYYFLMVDFLAPVAQPSGLYARLCHAFLVTINFNVIESVVYDI